LAFVVRYYQVTSSPPAPYWEEVALGYDAYSILQTGKDHHGNSYPLVAFESFGDWKPAGYFYAIVPFIKLVGLNVLAIRLPSIIAGGLIVFVLGWLVYLFTDHLTENTRQKLSLISMLLATVSPWLIQFSRAGWEVNLATLFILLGVTLGWKSLDLKNNHHDFKSLIFSVIFLVLSMYIYHSARVISPILGLFLGLRYLLSYLNINKISKPLFAQIGLIILILTIILWPFIKAWGSPVLGQRVAETTIFSNLEIIQDSNYFQNLYHNAWWTKLVFHRYWFFAKVILSQFFSHFSTSFLFISGDAISRHSSQYFGLFYPFEAIFLLVGSWVLLKKFSLEKKLFILGWLVIGVLPAAISQPVPHALRTLPTAPAFMILLTLGLWEVYEFLAQKFFCFNEKLRNFRGHILTLGFIMIYLFTFIGFYRHLLNVYPKLYAHDWQIGYEQMVIEVNSLRTEYPDLPIYITREQGRPAMYYWFYSQTDPKEVQAANNLVKKDQGEFLEFENIKFVNTLNEVTETPAITAHFENEAWQIKLKE
jgi:4-amino-4-deoxy-L-arabinose transferase-like glycosyltransferase